MSVARIAINGIIGEQGLLKEDEDTKYFSAENMRSFLDEPATQSADTIEVDLTTPGGDVAEGLDIHDMLEAEKKKGKKIITIGRQFDSIGSVVFAVGNERHSIKSANPLIHTAWLSPADIDPDTELNAQTLNDIAKQNSFADEQIIGVYANIVSRENLRELKSLMEDSTELTDEQLLSLGFSTKIVDGQAAKNMRLKPVAFNKLNTKISNQNQIEMAINKEQENLVDKFFAKLNNFVNGKTKSLSIPLETGGTIEVDVAEGEDPVGKQAFTTNEAAERINAEPGEYPMGAGKTLVIGEGGIVMAIIDAESAQSEEEKQTAIIAKAVSDALANAKAESDDKEEKALAALRAEKDDEMKALQAKNKEDEEEMKDLVATSKALRKTFDAIKGDSEDLSEADKLKNFKKDKEAFDKMTPSQKTHHNYKMMKKRERQSATK